MMDQPETCLELDAVSWDENDWEELLAYVEDGRVIPILGPDLLHVEIDGQETLLDQYLGSQLAAKFSLPAITPTDGRSLNDVVCRLMDRRSRLYPAIAGVLQKGSFTSPKPLRQLAEISHFQLFVSTTFDLLMEQALNEVRFGGGDETLSISYAPNDVQDIGKESAYRPTVFHLFGRYSTTPSYVICDEDLLEFVCALQTDARRPERLFDELEQNHLLILGENLPDWLARFFLRTTRQHRLLDRRDFLEFLADNRTHRDRKLVSFLKHFSKPTRIFPQGGSIEFVDELWRRWRARNPEEIARQARPKIPPPPEMPEKAVFISYASEDLRAVEELKAGLDAAGLIVWFDKDRLKAGDSFDRKIRDNIANCSLFLPVLSRNTEARSEGYFRREWNCAADRAKGIDPNQTFIIPIVIDETPQFVRVPDDFLRRQQTRLPEGRVTEEFVEQMQKLCGTAGRAKE